MRRLSRHGGLRLFRFFVRPVVPEQSRVAPGGLELRHMSEQEMLPLCRDPRLDLAQDKVSAAYAGGALCVAAFDAGSPIGYCWLGFAPLPHLDGVWVDFPASAVWTYKSLVLPSHRGRGVASALYRFADAACVERRRRISIICVESHNRPSITAAARAKYEDAGYAGYWLRGRALLTWRSSAAARQGVRFYVPPPRA